MNGCLAVVTGSEGFIGTHVTRGLARLGWSVLAVDRLPTEGPLHAPGIIHERCDVASRTFARMLLAARPHAVIHLAAQSSLAALDRDPDGGLRDNVLATASVVEAARAAGVGRVVFASSAAVYGCCDALPLREDAPVRPASTYGWTKAAGEQLVSRGSEAGGPSHAILRFANVYGPGQERKDDPGVISLWFSAVLRQEPLAVRDGGRPTRDFVYVGDVAEAIAMAVSSHVDGTFNISSGMETSLAELADRIAGVTGARIRHTEHVAQRGDIDRSVLSPALARKALGWKSLTPLDVGLRRTWRHMVATVTERKPVAVAIG